MTGLDNVWWRQPMLTNIHNSVWRQDAILCQAAFDQDIYECHYINMKQIETQNPIQIKTTKNLNLYLTGIHH